MTRSKKIFVGFVVLFIVLIGYASYDISSRTTFPGSKSQLPTRIERTFGASKDTVKRDTTRANEIDTTSHK